VKLATLILIAQGREEDPFAFIFNLLLIMMFLVIAIWGQKIQLSMILREIEYALTKIKVMRDEAKRLAMNKLTKMGCEREVAEKYANKFMEYVVIEPVDLDPTGIIPKLDHLISVSDTRVREEIATLTPEVGERERRNVEHLLEAAKELHTIYRTVRHYYIFSKRTSNYLIALQIHAQLPQIMQSAEALMGAAHAFNFGHPIGDGIGALVAARLMYGKEQREVARDTLFTEYREGNVRYLVIKSKGPGGNVGKPGDAVSDVLKKYRKVDLVIMVDAGLKLEGEKTGEIFEGIGAAIGGIGVEKYKIEEEVTKRKIPIYGIIIKMSIKEAISPMTKEIANTADKVVERIREIVKERMGEKGTVLVVGVGNTIGVGQ